MMTGTMKRHVLHILVAVVVTATMAGCFPWPRPAWSPDGRQVGFLAEDGIWIAERGTWKTRPLYQSALIVSGPAWADKGAALFCLEASPDRTQIILQRIPATGGTVRAAHAFDCPKELVHALVKDVGDSDEARVCLGLSARTADSLVAFELPMSEDAWAVHVFDAAKGRSLAVTNGLRSPSWSPDGKFLACARASSDEDEGDEGQSGTVIHSADDSGGEGAGIVILSVEGPVITATASIPFGRGNRDEDVPSTLCWSPDSRRLLTDDGEDVWLLQADGSQPARKVAKGLVPSFRPGNRAIALLRSVDREEGDGDLTLFLHDLASSNEVEIARQNEGFLPALCPLACPPTGDQHVGVWFCGTGTVPLIRAGGSGGQRWVPVTLIQRLLQAATFEGSVFELLEEEGDEAQVIALSKKALAAYEGLLSNHPDWRWRLPIELRCALLRRMLGQPARVPDRLSERLGALPEGKVKNAVDLLSRALSEPIDKAEALPGSPGRQDLRRMMQAAKRGMDTLFDKGFCTIGENVFWEDDSPYQAVGPPDALGSEAAAWQPPAEAGTRWIEVYFDPPARAHGLRIVQSPVVGGVVTIDLIGSGGVSRRILRPSDNFDGELEFPPTAWLVCSARIYARSRDAFAPNGIDAVKLLSQQGDRWAFSARGSEGRGDPLPDVPLSGQGRLTNRLDRFTLTLTSAHGVHRVSTTNGLLSLPAGEYYLNKQRIEASDAGGALWQLSGTTPHDTAHRVVAGADTCVSFGFPLATKPVLNYRKGDLSIGAEIRGTGGRKYAMDGLRHKGKQPPPPSFKVYDADGAVVHSGKLEYG